MVVGWYHSHPGFGCWLSGVDMNTQQSFEQLNPRAAAVVIEYVPCPLLVAYFYVVLSLHHVLGGVGVVVGEQSCTKCERQSRD